MSDPRCCGYTGSPTDPFGWKDVSRESSTDVRMARRNNLAMVAA